MPVTAESVLLSIALMPADFSAEQLAAIVVETCGLDPYFVQQRLMSPPPLVIGPTTRGGAQRAISLIAQGGGVAFAPTPHDLVALGPAHHVRDLRIEPGELVIVPWRGEELHVRTADLYMLVRATLREHDEPSGAFTADAAHGRRGAAAAGWGNVLATGIHLGLGTGTSRLHGTFSTVGDAPAGTERRVGTIDLLDIHLRDRRIFRVDGRRFAFTVLGALRGQGDLANMNALRDLLKHLAPRAIVDDYYAIWKPPAVADRFKVPGDRGLPVDRGPFAFYTRWVRLMDDAVRS